MLKDLGKAKTLPFGIIEALKKKEYQKQTQTTMIKTNDKIYLGHSSFFRAIINIFVVPFIMFIIIYYIDSHWSLLSSLMYLFLVSFLQYYRAKQVPTYENIFRKDIFFTFFGRSSKSV